MGLARIFAAAAAIAALGALAACTTNGGVQEAAAAPDLVGIESTPPGEPADGATEQGSAEDGAAAVSGAALAAKAEAGATVAPPNPAPAAKRVPAVTDPGQSRAQPVSRIAASQPGKLLPRPGSAVYRCSGGGSMMIDNRRSVVLLRDPDGETLELPASPAGQMTRYGKKPYALVLEGGEALFVKPRKPPFTCKR